MLFKEDQGWSGRLCAFAALVKLFWYLLGTICFGMAPLISANTDKVFMRSKTEATTARNKVLSGHIITVLIQAEISISVQVSFTLLVRPLTLGVGQSPLFVTPYVHSLPPAQSSYPLPNTRPR